MWNAGQTLRMSETEHGSHEGAPVAALRAEALVAEHTGHQVGIEIGGVFDAEAPLSGHVR
jgi:hypothetical protein